MTPMSSLNGSEDGGSRVAISLQWEAGGVGVSWRWRAGGALDMEVSLITGGCSNVGITYTSIPKATTTIPIIYSRFHLHIQI
jgi:hypothetical protein